ncbi:MAG: hypothetical protein ABIT38_11220 [Gemmatimonadaceae bacterium]
MTSRESVGRWKERLRATLWLRALLVAIGGAGVAAGLARLLGATTVTVTSLGAIAALASAALLTLRSARGAITLERTALWIEEHEPRLRYALVSAVEQDRAHEGLERAVRNIPWETPARAALWRSLRIPATLFIAGVVTLLFAPSARRSLGAATTSSAFRDDPRAMLTLGDLDVEVAAPAYAKRATLHQQSPALVRALPGSRIVVSGAGPTPAPIVRRDSTPISVTSEGSRWRAAWSTSTSRALVRASRGTDVKLLAIEPIVDSAPVVTLHVPARDTVMREPRGTFALTADAHDDIGVAAAAFEYIISSGEGERFTFRSGTLGARTGGGATDVPLRASLSLEALKLAPGDVVHLRATARDANDVTGPGLGGSDSRTIRIARLGEYDSVAVDPAPPAEADKSILSQRMLINLTETLVRRSRSMARTDMLAESQRIARDQTRLRKQVSDIIFARLGDAASGEHGHGENAGDDAEGRLTPEALLKAAEAATAISGEALDFDHDETPVVAINRPLLEAYNAMWDAGRELGSGSPQRALPPMRLALAAIQRARAAERLYLRGAPAPVVVDLAKVRMQGKERGTPNRRVPRTSLDEGRRLALARFARAVELLVDEKAKAPARADAPNAKLAAVDSLLVLRLDVAARDAAAAAGLEEAIDALRSGRDATALLVRARRLLDRDFVTHNSLGDWSAYR